MAIVNISNEVIEPQLNDPSIREMLEVLKEIKQEFLPEKTYGVSLKDLYKEHKELLSKLMTLLSNRFGLNYKLEVLCTNNFCVIPNVSKSNTGLYNNKDVYTSFSEILDSIEEYEEENRAQRGRVPEEERRAERKALKEFKELTNNVLHTLEETDNLFYTKGIIVDDSKAVIKGLPKDVYTYCCFDFKYGFGELDLTIEETLAIILHEIGHSYDAYSNIYKTYSTFTNFQNALKDLGRKNTDIKKAILLAYANATKDKSLEKEYADKDYVVATIGVLNKLIKQYGRDNTASSSVTKETNADTFATRFGFGRELASGLDKIYRKSNLLSNFNIISRPRSGLLLLDIVIETFRIIFGLFLLPFGIMIAIVTTVLRGIISVFTNIFCELGIIEDYETDKRRLQNIRNQVVHIIMHNKKTSDKMFIDKLNNDIEYIDGLIKYHNNYSAMEAIVSIVDAISSLSKGYRDKKERQNLHFDLENLLYNDLQVSANKIKTLL